MDIQVQFQVQNKVNIFEAPEGSFLTFFLSDSVNGLVLKT